MPATEGCQWHGRAMTAVQHGDLQVLASVMWSFMTGSPVHANSILNMHTAAEIFCSQHVAWNIQARNRLELLARA
jgi:hypothetical protein